MGDLQNPIQNMENDNNDRIINNVLPYVLRGGVFLAAILTAIGGILLLSRHGMENTDYSVFRKSTPGLLSLGGILKASATFDGEGLIMLGVLFLIVTPVARVIFSLVVYIFQKDRIYIFITSVVLCVLLSSLFSGYMH